MILLAEDDSELRSLVARVLREDGHEVIEASDATELLDLIATLGYFPSLAAVPDMILSDVRMPGGDGADILSRLMRSERPIPFVLMTSYGDDAASAEAIEQGASDVIEKPFRLERLRWAVRRVLG
ncbi:MAG: response regulator [Polyangiaceae bacterium]